MDMISSGHKGLWGLSRQSKLSRLSLIQDTEKAKESFCSLRLGQRTIQFSQTASAWTIPVGAEDHGKAGQQEGASLAAFRKRFIRLHHLLLKEFLCDGPRGADWHLYSALKFVSDRDDVLNQPV
ncbi:unnamed protein product [Leuciscus chuanchicus]